jgi:hypothetical protein
MTPPRSSTAAAMAVVAIIGCAVAGLGFVLGRDSATPADAQRVTPVAQADAVAEARKEGYKHGVAAGRRAAERGLQGELARARERGASEALALDRFDLAADTWYIVEFAAAGDTELQLSEVHGMEAGRSYLLCNTNGLCQD